MVNSATSNVHVQRALERRAKELWRDVQNGKLDAKAAMGEMEEWEMTAGGVRFALVPSSRDWLWFDSVHQRWNLTGFKAGKTVLSATDGMPDLGGSKQTAVEQPRSRKWLVLVLALLGTFCILLGAGLLGWFADFRLDVTQNSYFPEDIIGKPDGIALALGALLAAISCTAWAVKRLSPKRAARVVALLAFLLAVGATMERLTIGSRLQFAQQQYPLNPVQAASGLYLLPIGAMLFSRAASLFTMRRITESRLALASFVIAIFGLLVGGFGFAQVALRSPVAAATATPSPAAASPDSGSTPTNATGSACTDHADSLSVVIPAGWTAYPDQDGTPCRLIDTRPQSAWSTSNSASITINPVTVAYHDLVSSYVDNSQITVISQHTTTVSGVDATVVEYSHVGDANVGATTYAYLINQGDGLVLSTYSPDDPDYSAAKRATDSIATSLQFFT